MSSNHEIERWLESVPLKSLSPARERRLLDVLRTGDGAANRESTASRLPTTPWWQTPIPLWKAAVGCAAILAAAAMISWRPTTGNRPSDPPPIRVVVDAPLFAQAPVSRELDISQWRPVSSGAKE